MFGVCHLVAACTVFCSLGGLATGVAAVSFSLFACRRQDGPSAPGAGWPTTRASGFTRPSRVAVQASDSAMATARVYLAPIAATSPTRYIRPTLGPQPRHSKSRQSQAHVTCHVATPTIGTVLIRIITASSCFHVKLGWYVFSLWLQHISTHCEAPCNPPVQGNWEDMTSRPASHWFLPSSPPVCDHWMPAFCR